MKKEIQKILANLEKMGYEAYFVGGFVRDYLLGIDTYDIDICTSATPTELNKIYNLKPNNFGGIHFRLEDYDITITSFRKDDFYENGFPKQIEFNVDLKTDLKRRDFTINSLCMNKDLKVIAQSDYLNDLNKKIIRMVGDPLTRIKEDPLRIIRAIRFAINLNFKIEENLWQVIKENKNLLMIISKNRLEKEINKIKKDDKAVIFLKNIGYEDIFNILK